MPRNILVTGAAGYIGGSLVADLLANKDTRVENERIIAAVRSEEQAKALSDLGINVLQLDLTDEKVVVESLLHHNISIVVHTASSINPKLALHLITALGKVKEVNGEKTHFIHTSGLSAFYERTGWPQGWTRDTGPVFEVEKQLADSFPIRETDVAVIEHAKACGVTSFIVVPSQVYGKGSGGWNQLSIVFPVYVQACISQQRVYKFPENTKISGVHISDLTALYGQIIEKVLREETLPSGTEGYYFALAHDLHWWEFLDRLAAALKARGLIADSETRIWSSDEAAAEALGVPVQFLQPLWNSGANIISEHAHEIGWKPKWNTDRFLQKIDDEIDAVLELGQAKSSLIDSLFQSARN